ncbi:hypothetical protein [Streptomyces sp. NPDC002962]|uniref:hypothetical protein n=1 Tax=Streptomyces sp. NPDC002962 TaxID=3364674 RepID=UPI0036947224
MIALVTRTALPLEFRTVILSPALNPLPDTPKRPPGPSDTLQVALGAAFTAASAFEKVTAVHPLKAIAVVSADTRIFLRMGFSLLLTDEETGVPEPWHCLPARRKHMP